MKQCAKQVEALKQQIKLVEEQKHHFQHEVQQLGRVSDELSAKTVEVTEYCKEVNALRKALEDSRIRNEHLIDEIKDFRDHVRQLGEQIIDSQSQLAKAASEVSALKKVLAEKTAEVERYSVQVDGLRQEVERYRTRSDEYEVSRAYN